MYYPWGIYPNLWQTSDFLTTQSLSHMADYFQNNCQYNFQYTPQNQWWGIHQITYNIHQLSQGKIVIESLQCTFPNGQNFSYHCQWKKFNGSNFINEDGDGVYSIQCDLESFNGLLANKKYLELSLVIQNNSFQQNNCISMVTEMRDPLDINDINIVNVKMPIVQLIPTDLIKNNNNYIPLFRIGVEHNVFTMMDFQYPLIYIKKSSILGDKLEKFFNELYGKIIYIHQEVKDTSLKSFLQPLMVYVFSMNSLFKNQILTVDQWFQSSLILLGALESLLNFNCKTYHLYTKDLLVTYEEITQRIQDNCHKIYPVGILGQFVYQDNSWSLFVDFLGETHGFYVDFSAPMDKNTLINWVESSIIVESHQLDNALINKNRGLNRHLLNSKVNGSNDFVWLRYAIDNTYKYPHSLIIFNPQIINGMTVNLIKK
jgi:hypothetical protein